MTAAVKFSGCQAGLSWPNGLPPLTLCNTLMSC